MSILERASEETVLRDHFGRRFSYLRLSITEACNFRCLYCLPNGYKAEGKQDFLNVGEIQNLVRGFAQMGTEKVRLTGGEPTLRRDLFEIIEVIRDTPGIETIALSTNAYNLKNLATRLADSGVSQVNVSVDSLDDATFTLRTGKRMLSDVLEGIEAARRAGLAVKVNTVLMRDGFDRDLTLFQEWVRTHDVSVRFIELMPTHGNSKLFDEQHMRADDLRARLESTGWILRKRLQNDGPASEYRHAEYAGRIGVIAPYETHFCDNCNRLRVTSRGGLRLCLFGEGDLSVRDLLQDANQGEQLKARVRDLLETKEISHYLGEGRLGNNRTFSAMGG